MSKYRCFRLILSVLYVVPLSAPGALGAEKKSAEGKPAPTSTATEQLGTAEAWKAYAYKEKSGRVCYLAGEPQKSEPGKTKRNSPRAMVTHRPDENRTNEVSFVAGYRLKDGSDMALEIDGAKFDLFTKDDTGWTRTSDLDKTIVGAMAKGKQAVVKGIPQKGPPTTDTYSLAGFAQALGMVDKACGIKR
jgi:hypothetical protein